jgi:gentisate 1,2-dioxygenase
MAEYRAPPASLQAELDALYERLAPLSVDPGFRVARIANWNEPKKTLEPAQWRWSDGKAALDDLARIVGPELAERRNLIMRNPAEGHAYGTLRTMIGAYQMMLPGEFARSHWHSPHALRVILDGEGSYTVVDGVRLNMRPGDVVLTPGGSWHWHGVAGSEACSWLDVLDRPLTIMLEPVFQDYHPAGHEVAVRTANASPLLFPWAETLRRLESASEDPDGCFGRRIELGEPAPALPTLMLTMERLFAGEATRPYRSTANRLYCVMEGEGRSSIDGQAFDWKRGDILAVPAWRPLEHHADQDAVLFCACDEPVMRACGYFREQRG